MVCVYCASPVKVTNSRSQKRSNDIWRRRQCLKCGCVFTSIEKADLASALRVAHSPKALEPFNRDRLFVSILESCRHRPSALRDASNLTQLATAQLLGLQEQNGLISRNQLVDTVYTILNKFDKAAATYYAAYHPAKK